MTIGCPRAFAASTPTSSAGLSSARCARCIQYTTHRPFGSSAPCRRTDTRALEKSVSSFVVMEIARKRERGDANWGKRRSIDATSLREYSNRGSDHLVCDRRSFYGGPYVVYANHVCAPKNGGHHRRQRAVESFLRRSIFSASCFRQRSTYK